MRQLKDDNRPWLLQIHCTSHRLELAVKDSLGKEFAAVKDFMITIFYFFKRSGKAKRHFKETASVEDVHSYGFVKVHGTRFINHQRKGLCRLLHNWIILAMALENSISSSKTPNAKMLGILKKLKDFTFLCKCEFFLAIVEILSKLSLNYEKHSLQTYEVVPYLERTLEELNEKLEDGFIFLSERFTLDTNTRSITQKLPRN